MDGTVRRSGPGQGQGYNVKDEKGELKELVGVVHQITPGAGTCNMQLLHSMVPIEPCELSEQIKAGKVWTGSLVVIGNKFYWPQIEYGQCDHFEKVT
jgi:hypothetical protein